MCCAEEGEVIGDPLKSCGTKYGGHLGRVITGCIVKHKKDKMNVIVWKMSW
jgi:hypothetical protein